MTGFEGAVIIAADRGFYDIRVWNTLSTTGPHPPVGTELTEALHRDAGIVYNKVNAISMGLLQVSSETFDALFVCYV
jgi:hypothetical protein